MSCLSHECEEIEIDDFRKSMQFSVKNTISKECLGVSTTYISSIILLISRDTCPLFVTVLWENCSN